MKITVIAVGKIKEKYLVEAIKAVSYTHLDVYKRQHVSRPVRWDSDHVVSFDDETRAIMEELVRLNRLQDTYIATDFFDASINRICAWAIGLRNTRKAMLEMCIRDSAYIAEQTDEEALEAASVENTEEYTCLLYTSRCV